MFDFRVLLLGLFLFGFGLLLFFGGFKALRRRRVIQALPTSTVRSLAMGLVEVYGDVVVAKETLKTPLQGESCVYYHYTIEEYRRQGKSSRWVTIKQGSRGVTFFLRDKTGKVLVDPTGAEIDLTRDFHVESRTGSNPPASVISFLKANNMNFENFLGFNKQMRYSESYLTPGDKVYILGTAGKNPDVKAGTAVESVQGIMLQKGGKSEPEYYISDKSEKEVLAAQQWKVVGGLVGGPALIVGGLAVILLYFGLF